ncbi:MAG TPA: hypothetical protein VLG76_07790 [Rhabdochlamydiaceae bacterium]|nr:hypothetical protein [Rhabdochlamydiaceae bacterium]
MIKENPKYPLHILITHPRATATAFEKIMRTRQEMTVLHSPFLDPYLFKKYGPNHLLTQGLSDSTTTFEDVRKRLFQLAERSPVFFKESGYLCADYLKSRPEFYKHPKVNFAFLVRDPAKSILSFYRRMPKVDHSIIGHEQLWDLFTLFKDNLDQAPLVIDSDELLKDPLPILNILGERWGMTFDPTNLRWESGYSNDWRVKDWYKTVANSTKLGAYHGDVPRGGDGVPVYAEVKDPADRIRLQEFFRSQNRYYQKLLQFAVKSPVTK